MVIKQTIKLWCQKAVITGLIAVSIPLLFSSSVFASTYGSGSYDSCKYSQGCTATGAPKKTTPTADQSTTILLNDFPEFFEDNGKTLDLSESQIVNVNLDIDGQAVTFSITIKQVGDTFVIMGFAPKVFSATLTIGQSGKYDLNIDGQDDIIITLNYINDGKANLTFKAALNSTVSPPATNNSVSEPTPAKLKGSSWLWIILSILAILIVGLIFFILWWRRRRDDNSQWPPDQTVQPGPPASQPPPTSYTPPSQSTPIQG